MLTVGQTQKDKLEVNYNEYAFVVIRTNEFKKMESLVTVSITVLVLFRYVERHSKMRFCIIHYMIFFTILWVFCRVPSLRPTGIYILQFPPNSAFMTIAVATSAVYYRYAIRDLHISNHSPHCPFFTNLSSLGKDRIEYHSVHEKNELKLGLKSRAKNR